MSDKKNKNQKSKVNTKEVLVFFLLSLSLLSVYHINASAEERHHGHSPFKSIDEYIQRMESPDRVEWQKPEKVVDYLSINKGDTVADIGAGSGYFTVLFSKRVGDNGKVYAVDIEKGMIEYIEKRAQKEGLNNMNYILAKPDDPLLPKSSVDLIFICDTYHHIEKRGNYLKILKDVLKKLKVCLNDPPYNMVLHTAPNPIARPGKPDYWGTLQYDFHWHIELIPRLTKMAGFEWGSGLYINPVVPERAAKFLRETQI